MSETESRTRRRRVGRMWAAAGVSTALVGALLVWGVLEAGDEDTHRTVSPSSQSSSIGQPLASGTNPVTSEGVAFGEGASTKAADGVTPIGWPSTCAGAINAAATSIVALQNPTPGLDLGTPKARPAPARPGLKETIDYLLQGDPEVGQHSELAWPTADYGVATDVTSGGYRVVDCTPGTSATIMILSCSTFVGSNPADPGLAGKSVCGSEPVNVRWGGSPADWRRTEDPVNVEKGPMAGYKAVGGPLTPSQRRAILSRQPGWKEWANAPR